jgi:hypothetical protein
MNRRIDCQASPVNGSDLLKRENWLPGLALGLGMVNLRSCICAITDGVWNLVCRITLFCCQ